MLTLLALLTFRMPGGETTVTVEKTVTASGVRGSTPRKRRITGRRSTSWTRRADQINTEFRALVDQYNNGQVKAEELAAKSEQSWRLRGDERPDHYDESPEGIPGGPQAADLGLQQVAVDLEAVPERLLK